MRDGTYSSPEDTVKAPDTGETSFSLEYRYERMVAELSGQKAQHSLMECMREYVIV